MNTVLERLERDIERALGLSVDEIRNRPLLTIRDMTEPIFKRYHKPFGLIGFFKDLCCPKLNCKKFSEMELSGYATSDFINLDTIRALMWATARYKVLHYHKWAGPNMRACGYNLT